MATLVLSAVRSFQHNLRCRRVRTNFNKDLHWTSIASAETSPKSAIKPDLEISENCAKKLQEVANDGCFLRITVEGGGCSGFQYKFQLDKETNTDDRTFIKSGAKVVIDETSLEYVKGSTVDYHTELIRSAFRITNNPMAEQGCSCGASFTIKV